MADGRARRARRALGAVCVGLAAVAGSTGAARGAGGASGADPAGIRLRATTLAGSTVRYALYVPPGYSARRAWPCVVFLHGSGECGTDWAKPTRVGIGPALRAHPERWPCLVVFPQKPQEDEEWEEHEDLVLGVLAAVRREFHVDAERIALTGVSQGGHGAWMMGARHPGMWSCLAPVCGYGRAFTVAARVARLPVWAFHGLRDDIVDPRDTERIVAGIQDERRRLGLVPDGPDGARMTLYPDADHDSWDPAYAEPELPAWMLSRRRLGGPPGAIR